MIFKNIRDISLLNNDSWQNKIFITFDIDWCSDEVLSYTLDIIEEFNIKATFFVTHETKLLERMRNNSNIELGIHPNFNPLLNGDFRYGKNIDEVIEYYKKIVPEAVSVRSHAMTQNTHILNSFEKFGLIYDCNTFIPFSSQIELAPWKHWSTKMIKVPYSWEDDLHCIYNWEWNIKKLLDTKGLKIFDFHPIHVFLNTENIDRYEKSREYFNSIKILNKNKNNLTFGTYDFLINLIKEQRNENCINW